MQGKFYNPSQPQTMQGAVFLLYANVVVALLFRNSFRAPYIFAAFSLTRGNIGSSTITLIGNLLAILVVIGSGAAAYLIANEKKVGWRLGVVVAVVPLVAALIPVLFGDIGIVDVIDLNLLFDVALLVLLVHHQTTSYEKVWFK